jgi:putative hydrolase of HD superfamily
MAESIVGDLTPHDNISDEEKHRREQEAMDHIKGIVGDEVGQEFYDLWQEYEDQTTREAKFVKDLDKFDMIFQAFEYESAEKRQPEDLEQFFTSCQGKFQTDLVRGWVDQLNSLRAAATFNSRRQLDGGDLPSTTSKDILKQTDGGNDTSSSSS